ncbi:hypothetical protein NDU88_006344 [Pleurodeles waltl]|uniref:Uncharacterized protein n=1 Tax=Pleurodeles waltl TaxID=8319 RepID=A0AAV7MCN8_PLEWA|nr:hypothetical protein NDU88_006344 [Pleurodeles waltl]
MGKDDCLDWELREASALTGSKATGWNLQTPPIIACLLRHGHARQLLLSAWAHGPFRAEGYKIHITADFSKETNDCRKAFLALRPRMHQLEVKYGLPEPARLWVTKNGISKDFYDPADLRLFLDSPQPQTIDTSTPARPQRPPSDNRSASPPPTAQAGTDRRK